MDIILKIKLECTQTGKIFSAEERFVNYKEAEKRRDQILDGAPLDSLVYEVMRKRGTYESKICETEITDEELEKAHCASEWDL